MTMDRFDSSELARQKNRARKAFLKKAKAGLDASRKVSLEEMAQVCNGDVTPRPNRENSQQPAQREEGSFQAVPPQTNHSAASEADQGRAPMSVFGSMRRWLSALLQRGTR